MKGRSFLSVHRRFLHVRPTRSRQGLSHSLSQSVQSCSNVCDVTFDAKGVDVTVWAERVQLVCSCFQPDYERSPGIPVVGF